MPVSKSVVQGLRRSVRVVLDISSLTVSIFERTTRILSLLVCGRHYFLSYSNFRLPAFPAAEISSFDIFRHFEIICLLLL